MNEKELKTSLNSERYLDGPGYKTLLKERIHSLKAKQGQRFTNERVARDLRIEPPYLSRCLNHPDHHPSRELLFRLCARLQIGTSEIDNLLTHYDLTQATTEPYRRHLRFKLNVHRMKRTLEGSEAFRQWVQNTSKILEDVRSALDSLEGQVLEDDSTS